MASSEKSSTSLFDVYLRLRPPTIESGDCFLEAEEPAGEGLAHITLQPPTTDHRRRAVEKFAFTKIFKEDATQKEVLDGTKLVPLVEGVLGSAGKTGRDGLLATLGVTGSGKSHTILGSKTQRGLTQLAIELLYTSIGSNLLTTPVALDQLAGSDVSEAQITSASSLLEPTNTEAESRRPSRAPTPLLVSSSPTRAQQTGLYKPFIGLSTGNTPSRGKVDQKDSGVIHLSSFARFTRSAFAKFNNPTVEKDISANIIYPLATSRRLTSQLASLPQQPKIDHIKLDVDNDAEYAIVISMYEVYNDRIFDLLTAPTSASKFAPKDTRRRALLFKSTEHSPDRKVVAGLRKVICGSFDEALLVLEAGLTERRVAGTGSNAVSSRSHGFFCIEVKKRQTTEHSQWASNSLTIVDLAGSERARTANTAGATLAEAGKINESLMYLGQVMQMQSSNSQIDRNSSANSMQRPGIVPFRQCKLTELLFSNSFHPASSSLANQPRHQTQKAIMIVTADPRGDFNATSQILRYSALAREVTVPRVISVTQAIFAPITTPPTELIPLVLSQQTPLHPTRVHNPPVPHHDTVELSRLRAQVALLQQNLTLETRRREETETSWELSERRLAEIEAAVREECWNEFEARLEAERTRQRAAWDEEHARADRHLDGKIEILTRGTAGLSVYDEDADDAEGTANGEDEAEARIEDLERENEALRIKLRMLEREKEVGRTPSRKLKPLKAKKWVLDDGLGVDRENEEP